MDEQAKEMQRAYMREWRKKNPDRIKQHNKSYRRKQDPEKVRAYKRKWYAANRDKARAHSEKYWIRLAKEAHRGPTCLFCQEPFTAKRSDARFCSVKCRMGHSRYQRNKKE